MTGELDECRSRPGAGSPLVATRSGIQEATDETSAGATASGARFLGGLLVALIAELVGFESRSCHVDV